MIHYSVTLVYQKEIQSNDLPFLKNSTLYLQANHAGKRYIFYTLQINEFL